MNGGLAVVGFLVCAAVIFVAGGRLSKYGDRIAALSGWSRAWVGLILIASVTSLPELVVGVSSSAVVRSADLAVGDVLGSCAINLVILAGLDAVVPKRGRLLASASSSHVLAASLGIVLLATVGVGLITGDRLPLTGWLGLSSVAFLVLYAGSVRLIFRHGRSTRAEEREPAEPGALRGAVLRYAGLAVLVVVAAILLPPMAESIAEMSGLTESFVGTVFLAASTSMPELAVSYAAVRMGAVDLAVGNILGSNLFNVIILALDDLAYTDGVLLADASPQHLLTVLATIAMSAGVLIGLSYRPAAGKRFVLAGDAAMVLVIYAGNALMLAAL